MGGQPASLTEQLRRRWLARCQQLDLDERPSADQGQRLLEAYGEPHRHYHDLRHLDECLGMVDSMPGLADDDRLAAELALWFHDVVYDPRAPDNEARSADRARAWLALARVALADRVAALVEMTAGHLADPGDDAATAVADADLAILGSAPERYREYAEAIRREYAHLVDDDFATGRTRVLQALAARDPIYLRPDVRAAREARARENIGAELARLAPGLSP